MSLSAMILTRVGAFSLHCVLLIPIFPTGEASAPRSALVLDGSGPQTRAAAPSELAASQGVQAAVIPKRQESPVAKQSGVNPLHVTYDDGELTIVAQDIPLSDVLSEIRRVTGADIDIPPSAAAERVWVRFGPGPARSILRELLDGTNLDFVIQASDIDEDGILSVSLTARGKPAESAAPPTQIERSAHHAQSAALAPAETAQPDEHANEAIAAAEPPTPDAPASSPKTSPASAISATSRENAGLAPSAPMVGSSEQMAQQLQNLYQQRRQMQMQQNQKPGQPAISN